MAWDFKIKTLQLPESGDTVRLYLWDTAGQERFRHIARMYYKDVAGVLLCFDLTDEDSFKASNYWLSDLQRHAPEKISKIFIGNKADMCQGINSSRKISHEQAQAFATEHGMQYREVSAKTNEGINQAFLDLAVEINKTQGSNVEMALGGDQQVVISESERIGNRMNKKKLLKSGGQAAASKKSKCC